MPPVQSEKQPLRIGQIATIIDFIIGILGFFGISATVIINFIKNSWSVTWWWVLLAVAATVVAYVTVNYVTNHSRNIIVRILNLFAPKLPYSLKMWETTYEYLSENTMQFEALFQVAPQQTGVDHIRARYNWSAATEDNPIHLHPIKTQGYQTSEIVPDGCEFGYSFYKIYSRTSINKGDPPIKLGVKIPNLVEKEKKASPHLLTNINVLTEKLVMTVILPSSIHPEDIEFLEYIHATDDHHWHRYVAETHPALVTFTPLSNNRKKITWPIAHPIIGGKYIIRWRPQNQAGS